MQNLFSDEYQSSQLAGQTVAMQHIWFPEYINAKMLISSYEFESNCAETKMRRTTVKFVKNVLGDNK